MSDHTPEPDDSSPEPDDSLPEPDDSSPEPNDSSPEPDDLTLASVLTSAIEGVVNAAELVGEDVEMMEEEKVVPVVSEVGRLVVEVVGEASVTSGSTQR